MKHLVKKTKSKSNKNMLHAPCFMFHEDGQILIEAIIALLIIVVAILGAVTLVSNALSYNKTVSENFVAVNLASEGIEIAKNIVEGGLKRGEVFNEYFRNNRCYEVDYATIDNPVEVGGGCNAASNNDKFSTTPLKYDSATGRYGYGSGNNTGFTRTIKITSVGGGNDEMKVVSIVRWNSRRGGIAKVVLEDHFYNWRATP